MTLTHLATSHPDWRSLHDALLALYTNGTLAPDKPAVAHMARARLYGDVLIDALLKDNYQVQQMTPADMYWLPRCIGLQEIGQMVPQTYWLELIQRVEMLNGVKPFSRCLRAIVAGVGECWDGSGAPLGLRAAAIPLASRIASVVNAYVHLLPMRELSNKTSQNTALQRLSAMSARKLDPKLVSALVQAEASLAHINRRFGNAVLPITHRRISLISA